jgi:hypothetical protein
MDRADVTEVGSQHGDARIDVAALAVRVDEGVYRENMTVMWNST